MTPAEKRLINAAMRLWLDRKPWCWTKDEFIRFPTKNGLGFPEDRKFAIAAAKVFKERNKR